MFRRRLMRIVCIVGVVLPLAPTASASVDLNDSRPALASRAANSDQTAFSIYLEQALFRYPGDVADFAWEDGMGVLYASPNAHEGLEALAEEHGVTVRLHRMRGDAIPFLARDEVQLKALAAFRDTSAAAVGASYSPHDHSITITVWANERGEAFERIDTVEHLNGYQLRLEFADPLDPPAVEATRGGEDYGTCTGGFMGTRNGANGILTAAHCATVPPSYHGSPTGATFAASGGYDVRFTVTTGGGSENTIRISTGGTTRAITSTGMVFPGQSISKYGRVTGGGTTQVDQSAGCVIMSNGQTWCGLFKTTAHITNSGDSGGPWYSGNTAHATTTGGNTAATYITPVLYVSNVGASVKTS